MQHCFISVQLWLENLSKRLPIFGIFATSIVSIAAVARDLLEATADVEEIRDDSAALAMKKKKCSSSHFLQIRVAR